MDRWRGRKWRSLATTLPRSSGRWTSLRSRRADGEDGAPSGPRRALARRAAARRLLVVRPGDPGRAQKLRALADAVARRKRIHIRYESPPNLEGKPGKRSERDVDPWGLAFRGRAWRLVGWCHEKREQRVFLVDRIGSVEINAQKPHTPDFEPAEGLDAAV